MNYKKLSQEQNIQNQIDLIKSKYGEEDWEGMLAIDGNPASIAKKELEGLTYYHEKYKNRKIEYYYQMLIDEFIQNSKDTDNHNLFQGCSLAQINNLISFTKGDFTLFLFCKLYVGVIMYRMLVEEHPIFLNLIIDMIHTEALKFTAADIINLDITERYKSAEYFVNNWIPS